MKKKLVLLLVCSWIAVWSFAQTVTLGNQGLRVPTLTTTERNAILMPPTVNNVAKGLLIFNIDNTSYEYWDGKKWCSLASVNEMPSDTWIYCPPFLLEWSSGATKTVDLFAKYTTGLSGYTTTSGTQRTTETTAVANRVLTATDFDYLVRYEGVAASITITSVTAAGVMTYVCSTIAPSNADFVSVVLIKK